MSIRDRMKKLAEITAASPGGQGRIVRLSPPARHGKTAAVRAEVFGANKAGLYDKSVVERFLRKLGRDGECMPWEGRVRTESMHGQFDVAPGTVRQAQRVAYELAIGPIPLDMVIGQSCGRARCCSPAHLEVITRGEAARRGNTGLNTTKRSLEQTHCKWGHTLADAYIRKDGRRQCRACHNEANRALRAKKRGK